MEEVLIMSGKSMLVMSMLLVLIVHGSAAWASPCHRCEREYPAQVRILSDGGEEFARYRTYPRAALKGTYFYMEAVKGERYSIEVKNRSERQIAVVIAVDGRNIINGEKSELKPTERMYIISPHATNVFEGWRTGMDRTNRFYFTEQSDSYAEKVFADASAMGTIAVAVYREKILPEPIISDKPRRMKDGAASVAPQSSMDRAVDRNSTEKTEQAGTGFGETTYSPARVVEFEPERSIAEKIVFKYEWRKELCRKGIVICEPRNRMWPDNNGFAPVPRDFKG